MIPAANVTEQTPRMASATMASSRVGAAAARSEAIPKPRAALVISALLACARAPIVRAPPIEPMPIAIISSE